MQTKFGDGKGDSDVSHYAFPIAGVGQDDCASASCCFPGAAVFLVRFRRHNDFDDDGMKIASVLLLDNPFPLIRGIQHGCRGNGQQNTLFKRWLFTSAERRLRKGSGRTTFQI